MSWNELSNAAGQGQVATLDELLATRTPTAEELREALAFAAIHDKQRMIERLVQLGADPNAGGKMSGPALHFVRSLGTAQTLIRLGARPEAGDFDALQSHLSSNRRSSDLELVRCFLDAGVDPSHPPRNGTPHLLLACETGNLAIIELLLDRGADPRAMHRNESVYSAASSSGSPAKVLALLARRGLDPNEVWSYAGSKTTLLAELCKAGELEAVAWLLDHGADPNLAGDFTPLARAEESGQQVLVDLLLEKGAKPLRPALDAGLTAALDATERGAVSPDARLAHARALKKAGFHAAAASEVFALGNPESARELLELPWRGWRISAAPPVDANALAPRLLDGLWRGALATNDRRTVPLVFLFGAPCTTCDEKGELECSMCNGTGSYSSFLDPDHDVTCGPRQACPTCLATKFTVRAAVKSRGTCKHPFKQQKRESVGSNEWFTFQRCEVCSLPGFSGSLYQQPSNQQWACAACARFVCAC